MFTSMSTLKLEEVESWLIFKTKRVYSMQISCANTRVCCVFICCLINEDTFNNLRNNIFSTNALFVLILEELPW